MEFSEELMIPNPSLSINEGCNCCSGLAVLHGQITVLTHAILDALCKEYGFDLDTPFEKYPKKIHDVLIHADKWKECESFL